MLTKRKRYIGILMNSPYRIFNCNSIEEADNFITANNADKNKVFLFKVDNEGHAIRNEFGDLVNYYIPRDLREVFGWDLEQEHTQQFGR